MISLIELFASVPEAGVCINVKEKIYAIQSIYSRPKLIILSLSDMA